MEGDGAAEECSWGWRLSESVGPLICPQKFVGILQVPLRFPGVLRRRVSFPFDKELHISPSLPMSDDRFHFEFFFAVNQVRRWQCEIGAMCAVLTIRGQKACVEDRVNSPLVRQFQLVRQRSQDLYDFKWSLALHRELFVIREESEVLGGTVG